ncbi:MAG: arginine--tRNA ligase [Labilithrix sp.]|nr:arginine--tRNA ligase [Labilithrix sp.]MCW5817411.1 arginine--tRNA ligase [Labilithrix sp.]
MSLVDRVRTSIESALGRFLSSEQLAAAAGGSWTVERPKRAEHGDYATNVAMVLTKKVGMPPRAIAEGLAKALAVDPVVKSVEIAGPGFVNLRVHPHAVHEELATILAQGSAYGRAPAKSKERIDVEFVSANPTGPITVAAARNGIYGDAVAELLELTGNAVTREYYLNDFGNQIKAFAESVRLAHEKKERGEGHYQGAYIDEIARYLETRAVDPFAADDVELARTCITTMIHGIPGSKMLPGIRRTLHDLGIDFDVWFSEESLHRWGAVDVAIERLRKDGYLVEKDGATFFVTKEAQTEAAREPANAAATAVAKQPPSSGAVSAGGGVGGEAPDQKRDKDRVVKKSDGNWTYFASDIAYHSDKLSRGYDRVIDVLGADHHGYIPRMRNVLDALGLPQSKFEILIYQLVNILRNGETVKSSKRAGNVITADEVMDEIDEAAAREGAGRDALRFFFLSRSANTTVDFDLEIAKSKSLDNPVFYVQYGHARLSSILKKAEAIGGFTGAPSDVAAWAKLDHPDELAIAMHLARWPEVLAEAAALREPHRVVFYVQELARDFQSYFTRMKTDPVLPKDSTRAEPDWQKTWDMEKTNARLGWIRAIRAVYANALGAIGVSAPDRMDLPTTTNQDDEATA